MYIIGGDFMLFEVLMPKHGLNMSEGYIADMKKKTGDSVQVGEVLFAFETDKAAVEVESKVSGTIVEVAAAEGDSIPVDDTVYIIDTEAIVSGAAPAASPEDISEKVLDTNVDNYVPATPWVKKVAKENSVDLTRVSGTGKNNRITEENVMQNRVAPSPKAASPKAVAPEIKTLSDGEEIKMNRIKKLTGERMSYSFREVPHIYFSAKVNMERMVAYRAELFKETGVKYTYSDFILVAVARALQKYPLVNATFSEGRIFAQEDINIGFATATPNGLVVPVIHEAQRYNMQELAKQRKAVVQKALDGALDIWEMEGGTFTITNLGNYGIDTFDPIINPPQAAILAAGSMKDEVVVENKAIKICPVICFRLAGDHRVLDGIECAKFLAYFKELMEGKLPLV